MKNPSLENKKDQRDLQVRNFLCMSFENMNNKLWSHRMAWVGKGLKDHPVPSTGRILTSWGNSRGGPPS